ncbi:MAG TPA: hypothetical protein VHO46_13485 [Bacteroidales bacterium]|nr:hypothetical protein [Bacteroidales bacterium]
METKDIIILVAALTLAGFSLYRKYVSKKGAQGQKPGNELTSDKDDDYEPYSGK